MDVLGYIIFSIAIMGIAWFCYSDVGEDMHYSKEHEEYLERLRREKEERKKNDKDRPK